MLSNPAFAISDINDGGRNTAIRKIAISPNASKTTLLKFHKKSFINKPPIRNYIPISSIYSFINNALKTPI